MNIVGLILAAGESSRMGSPKALLNWNGKTLIEHHVEVLNKVGIFRIVVVLGAQADRIYPMVEHRNGVMCVYNQEYHLGKTTSIKAGLSTIVRTENSLHGPVQTSTGVMVLNVDQPRSERTIAAIIEGYKDSPSGASIVIPTYQGKGGHPIILAPDVICDALRISEDSSGLKEMKIRYSESIAFFETDMSEILIDLNTRQDYEKALRLQEFNRD